MRRARVLGLACILALIALSQSGAAQSAPWVSSAVATQFVNNFLHTYNSEVSQFHAAHPDQPLLGHFLLYAQGAQTFNVTVMRLYANYSSYVCFVFAPIVGYAPRIIVENNITFIPGYVSTAVANSFGNFQPINSLGREIRQGVFTGQNASGYYPFVWIGYTSSLVSNPVGYSDAVAQYAFNNDSSSYPPKPWYSPVTDFLSSLNDSPAAKPINSVFGSLVVPVIIVVAAVVVLTREGVKRVIREALGKKQPIPKKKKRKRS